MSDSEGSVPLVEFVIVKFPKEDDLVAVVPSTWMIGRNKCSWPPHNEEKKVGLFVKKMKDPAASWQVLDCIELERYDTYNEARQMLPIAEMTSDLNTEVQYGRGKRRRVRRVSSSSDEQCEDLLFQQSNTCSYTKRSCDGQGGLEPSKPKQTSTNNRAAGDCHLRQPPRKTPARHDCDIRSKYDHAPHLQESSSQMCAGAIRKSRAQVSGTPSALRGGCADSSCEGCAQTVTMHAVGRRDPPWDPLSIPQQRRGSSGSSDLDMHAGGSQTRSSLLSTGPQFTSERCPPGDYSTGSPCESLTSESPRTASLVTKYSSEFERKVLRALSINTLRLSEHTEQLDMIISCLQGQMRPPDESIIKEPFCDVKQFLKFDEELRASPKKKEMLKVMANLGGRNPGDKCRRMLCQLLTDEVAVQFNWTGTLGKRAFKSLNCAPIITRAVSTSCGSDTSATVANTEKVVQTWLRHANERLQKAFKTREAANE